MNPSSYTIIFLILFILLCGGIGACLIYHLTSKSAKEKRYTKHYTNRACTKTDQCGPNTQCAYPFCAYGEQAAHDQRVREMVANIDAQQKRSRH